MRDGADEARLGIYDLIERLDQNPTAEDRRVLNEIAIAAQGKFDQGLQEALFDLAASGWATAETALEVLARVGAGPGLAG